MNERYKEKATAKAWKDMDLDLDVVGDITVGGEPLPPTISQHDGPDHLGLWCNAAP